MFKLLFLFIAFVMVIPVAIVFLLFAFPPTRKLFGYILNRKFQKMTKNGHVYYRSYHFRSGNLRDSARDVTPKFDNVIDVTPISESNLRKAPRDENTSL